MWPDEYADLNFSLPEELIAQYPAEPADHARLMVLDRKKQSIMHDYFYNIGNYLVSGDAVVYNATHVEERRVYLRESTTEKVFECVFLARQPAVSLGTVEKWQVLLRNSRRLKNGALLHAVKDPSYEFVFYRLQDKIFVGTAKSLSSSDFARIGEMPLPPYMKRAATAQDSIAYQNFFRQQIAEKNKVRGSAAAPTAALHFTHELFTRLRAQGIGFYPLCLDIGYGTFAPLTEQNFTQNILHSEHYFIPQTTAQLLASGKRRRIALGTTSLRAILSYHAYGLTEAETQIFIKPGDNIANIEGLITNFHLPQSSLLLLVAAFAGRQFIRHAYHEAVEYKYRFFSYGDAMLVI